MCRLPPASFIGISNFQARFNTATPSLCGAEGMVPLEVIVLSTRLALISKISDPSDRIYDVEVFKEKRLNSEKKNLLIKLAELTI